MSREKCRDCPQQTESICCHEAINDINDYDQRANDAADQHVRLVNKPTIVYGTLVAKPWEND